MSSNSKLLDNFLAQELGSLGAHDMPQNMPQYYYDDAYRIAASIKAGEPETPPSMSCTTCKKIVPMSDVRQYHSREYSHRLLN